MASILAEFFPQANQFGDKEDYAGFLTDLLHFDVRKDCDLRNLLQKNAKKALKAETEHIKLFPKSEYKENGILHQRVKSGVYFSHAGLGRTALKETVGVKKWNAYVDNKDSE